MKLESSELAGFIALHLKEFDDMQHFEYDRFEEIRKDPESIYVIKHADVLMSPTALSKLFIVGGVHWLEQMFEFLETLHAGACPMMFNNVLEFFRPSGELIVNMDLADLLANEIFTFVDSIDEDLYLQRLVKLFTLIGEQTPNHAGAKFLINTLNNEDYLEVFDPFTLTPDEKLGCYVLSAPHLQEDVVALEPI